MPPVPAHCDNCGLTWEPLGGIVIENSANVKLHGNTINCPRCGRRARFIEGTFNFKGDVIEILSAPAWTRERLSELRGVLQSAARAWPVAGPDGALQEVSEVSPELANLLQRSLAYGRSHALELLMTLLALLAWVLPDPFGIADESQAPPTPTEVTIDPDQISQLFDRFEQEGRPAPPSKPGKVQSP